jgi:hypothetical protein
MADGLEQLHEHGLDPVSAIGVDQHPVPVMGKP